MRSAAESLFRSGGVEYIRKYKGPLLERGKLEGKKEGILLGMKKGKLAGKKEGKLEGKEEGVAQVALLMRNEGIPEEVVNKITSAAVSEVVS